MYCKHLKQNIHTHLYYQHNFRAVEEKVAKVAVEDLAKSDYIHQQRGIN